MKRLLISILVLFCWFIEPVPAENYRANGRTTNSTSYHSCGSQCKHNHSHNASSQNPTMNMRSTSSYSTNSYSMYYSANDKMQESGVRSYGSMNMNVNTSYCPTNVAEGMTLYEAFGSIPLDDGGPRHIPGFNNKGHNWVYNGPEKDTYTCSKCGITIEGWQYDWEDYEECLCPLEFDWKVMVFMAVLAAGYVAVKRRKALAPIHRGRP